MKYISVVYANKYRLYVKHVETIYPCIKRWNYRVCTSRRILFLKKTKKRGIKYYGNNAIILISYCVYIYCLFMRCDSCFFYHLLDV